MIHANAIDKLRVSVATYNQVIFPHPENGMTMLALERKGTVLEDGSINVQAQPFGGGVRILNSNSLKNMLGEIQFDSKRSKQEQDFRILIQPSQWEAVKQYCLLHLANPDDPQLETSPDRELVEEFEETIHVELDPKQYTVRPMGIVVEDHPVWTDNWYARGCLTVRIYSAFEVQITDIGLCKTMLAINRQYSDQEFGMRALEDSGRGGNGRVNTILTLPLNVVRESYLALLPEKRYAKTMIDDHKLDESVLVVLGDVDVPQYQRF